MIISYIYLYIITYIIYIYIIFAVFLFIKVSFFRVKYVWGEFYYTCCHGNCSDLLLDFNDIWSSLFYIAEILYGDGSLLCCAQRSIVRWLKDKADNIRYFLLLSRNHEKNKTNNVLVLVSVLSLVPAEDVKLIKWFTNMHSTLKKVNELPKTAGHCNSFGYCTWEIFVFVLVSLFFSLVWSGHGSIWKRWCNIIRYI